MQIGIKTQYSKQFRIGILLSSIVIFTLSISFFEFLIFDKDKSITTILIQRALTGLIFGLIFPPIMKWLAKKMYSKTVPEVDIDLKENEIVEAEGPANLFRKMEGVGGKLFITNQRLVFNSHKLNIQRGATSILYSEIESVQPRKTSGLIDNGISIQLKSGDEHKFVVNDRETWLKEIQARLKS